MMLLLLLIVFFTTTETVRVKDFYGSNVAVNISGHFIAGLQTNAPSKAVIETTNEDIIIKDIYCSKNGRENWRIGEQAIADVHNQVSITGKLGTGKNKWILKIKTDDSDVSALLRYGGGLHCSAWALSSREDPHTKQITFEMPFLIKRNTHNSNEIVFTDPDVYIWNNFEPFDYKKIGIHMIITMICLLVILIAVILISALITKKVFKMRVTIV